MTKQLTDNRIKLCIKGCGWKQKAIAEAANISEYHLSRMLNGKDFTPKMRDRLNEFIQNNIPNYQEVIKKQQLLLLKSKKK